MDNPYKAPRTPVKDAPPVPRSPTLAVVAGLAVDFGGNTIATAVLGLVFATRMTAGGNPEQYQEAFSETAPTYAILATAIGVVFSFLGGYVCARFVRRRERRSAVVLAAISGGVGLAFVGPFGPWVNLGLALLTFAVVMLGSELGRQHNSAGTRVSNAE